MNQAQRRLFLIRSLLKEKTEYRDIAIPTEPESQRQLLRGLMNIRFPQSIGTDFLKMQDAYLHGENAARGITDVADLTPIRPGLYLWQGDITTLKCDAIVNAANPGMTGCYIPATAASTTPFTPLQAWSCGLPVRNGWNSRTVRNPPDRRKSRPHSICPAAMCCIRSVRSSAVE